MRKALICLVPITALALIVHRAGAALAPQSANSSAQIGNKIYAHKLAVALGKEPARGKEMPLSSGVLYTLMEKTGVIDRRAAKWAQTPRASCSERPERARHLGQQDRGLLRTSSTATGRRTRA